MTVEVPKSSSYRGSYKSIHYGDITLGLTLWQGVTRYQIQYKLHYAIAKFAGNSKAKCILSTTLYFNAIAYCA